LVLFFSVSTNTDKTLQDSASQTMRGFALLLCCLAGCRLRPVAGQVPMGPGSMQPYAGGGGRQRGFGYVREPAMGFFIAGSTLRDMNGVYARVENVRAHARMPAPSRNGRNL